MAEAALTILSIPLLLFLPGWASLPGRTARIAGMSLLEAAFLRLLLSVLFTSFAGLLLAQLGWFSLLLLSLLALAYASAVVFLRRRRTAASAKQVQGRPAAGAKEEKGQAAAGAEPQEAGSALRPGREWLGDARARSEEPGPAEDSKQEPGRQAASAEPGAGRVSPVRFRAGDLWLVAIALLCLFLARRPFECLTGGVDAGVYLNSGVLLARSGGLRLEDEVFSSLPEKQRQLFSLSYADDPGSAGPASAGQRRLMELVHEGRVERLRGFFLEGEGKGPASRPQFLPLLPVWIALFHAWGGLGAALATNAFLGGLALAAAYFLGRRAFGGGAGPGIAFSALLAGNVAELWFMRYPTAEILIQALFLGSLLLVLAGRSGERPPRFLIAWGGACLGAATLAKFFGLFLLIPVGLAWYLTAGARQEEGRRWWRLFLSGLLPAAAFGGLGALLFSAAYLRSHLFNLAYVKFYLAGLVLLLPALVLRRRLTGWLGLLGGSGGWSRRGRRGGALFVAGAALYAYFLRPRPIEVGGSNNFLELGWYVGGIGLLLGVAGFILHLLGREPELPLRRARHFTWVAVVATLVVMTGTADMPLHIFSIRRVLPVTLPALLLFAVLALRALWRGPRLAGPLLALLGGGAMAVLPLLDGGWRTVVHREQEGAVEQLRDLASAVGPRDLVVFDSFAQADLLALPLRLVFDHPGTLVYYGETLESHQQLVHFLQRPTEQGAGRTWFVSPQPSLFGRPPERPLDFAWPRLETSAHRLPTRAREVHLRLGLFCFPDREAWRYVPERVDVGGEDFPLVEGFHEPVRRQVTVQRPCRRLEPQARIRVPVGTVEVGLLLGRLGDRPVEVALTLDGEPLNLLHPTGDFRLRTVKVSRGDGTVREGELVLSTSGGEEQAEGSVLSLVAVERLEFRGRYGLQRLPLDGPLPAGLAGFGAPEWVRDRIPVSYRWSGPRSRIRVPGPAVGLRLGLFGGFRPESVPAPRVLIRLNGRTVKSVVPGRGLETVEIPIPPSETGLPAQVLTLESTTWNPARAGRDEADAQLGVVVEGVDRVLPVTSLERGLMRIGQGHAQEGLSLVRRFARRFGGTADWRIPLGLGLAGERLGLAGRARQELKESLRLRPLENEALRVLHRLAVRHDKVLRQREAEKAGEAASGERALREREATVEDDVTNSDQARPLSEREATAAAAGGGSPAAGEVTNDDQALPPSEEETALPASGGTSPVALRSGGGEAGAPREVSRPWVAGLTGRRAGLPAVLRSASPARSFSFRLDCGGEAILQLVARAEGPAAGGEEAEETATLGEVDAAETPVGDGRLDDPGVRAGGREEAGEAAAAVPRLRLTLDGNAPLTLEVGEAGWKSYVLPAACGLDLEHRLELTVEGERGVEVQRIQAY